MQFGDVTRGGATAFPRLGVAVWPKKGAAAFWYNMKRSGAGHVHTLHGACPVVHGTKWGESMKPLGMEKSYIIFLLVLYKNIFNSYSN